MMQKQQGPIIPCWTHLTEGYVHAGIRRVVVCLGTWSAKHPFTTIALTCVVSLALLVIGYFTNFQLELNQLHFVSPTNSLPRIHSEWIQNSQLSGFPNVRVFYLNVHRSGDNVLTARAMSAALEAMEVLQTTLHYGELCQTCDECSESERNMLYDGKTYCRISSVTQFWDHSMAKFQHQMTAFGNVTGDDYVRQAVSHPTYPDGTPVYHEAILGKYEGYNTTSGEKINVTTAPPLSLATLMEIYQQPKSDDSLEMHLTSAQCLVIKVDIPDVAGSTITDDFEHQALQRLAELQKKYQTNQQDEQYQNIHVEYFTMNGYQYEMMRAMYSDLPLVGVLIVVMVFFTVMAFSDFKNRVQSRGMLGIYSFSTIGLSLFAGYGIMFCIGVPVTTVSILIPFVVCGVGLDDAFIITGAYFRILRQHQQQHFQEGGAGDVENDESNHHNDTTITTEQERKRAATLSIVQATLNESAVSITMTTITTLIAFITGGTSQIPAVRWLCWYAAISLFVVYIYQITFFIALLVLDERRVQANRKDLCIWIVVNKDNDEDTAEEDIKEDTKTLESPSSIHENLTSAEELLQPQEENGVVGSPRDKEPCSPREFVEVSLPVSPVQSTEQAASPKSCDTVEAPEEPPTTAIPTNASKSRNAIEKSTLERLMGWYADQLLKPISKVIVVLVFAVYFAGTVYSTTLLHQEFKIKDYIPADSFMTSSMSAFEDYSTYLIYIDVYFRNVDQSDPQIQLQMSKYVHELSELDQIGAEPGFFWLRDFQQLAESNITEELIGINLKTLSFNEQVNLALSIPQLRQIYGRDIVRDSESGNITASRTSMFLRDFDMYNVPDQIALLMDQRDVSLRQPANDPSKLPPDGGFNFFTFAELYFYWQLFAQAINELIVNTILCVVVVSLATFILIPHWSACAFACPLLIMLYFNLMGTMQYCGVTINVISYFILVMSIGLLVDYLMHFLLKFYETKGATRNEKVKETLETIGVSIMMGAFTTLLGVVPMAFSTTKIFRMVFVCFLAMIILGSAAGLIFLPVLLSLFGPVESVQHDRTDGKGGGENKTTKCEKEEIEPIEEIVC